MDRWSNMACGFSSQGQLHPHKSSMRLFPESSGFWERGILE